MSVEPAVDEVAEDPAAFAGQDRFRMELDAVDGPAAVPQAHDHAIARRPGGHFELRRETLLRDDERVVSRGQKGTVDAAEDAASVVLDGRRLPMHRHDGPHNLAAECRANRLVPQAHAENRRRLSKAANHGHRDARVLGPSRPGRDDDALGLHLDDLLQRRRVVAHDSNVGAELPEVLHQVVGERIVVVEDENHSPACAISSARTSARALSRVSSNSAAGLESITMPAPACTNALPFDMITVRMAMQKSRLPAKSRYPTAPAYKPRPDGSSSRMICIARTFGAPETVPAGKHDTSASRRSR